MRAFFLFFLMSLSLQAQVYFFTSEEAEQTIWHRIMMDENYFVETAYVDSPAAFIYTRGGFYKKEGNKFLVAFEFNSNFEKDHLKTMDYEQQADWELASDEALPLDGKWLMAGRVTEQGINRRDTTQARKTMKFLKDGFSNGSPSTPKVSNSLVREGAPMKQQRENTKKPSPFSLVTIPVLERYFLLNLMFKDRIGFTRDSAVKELPCTRCGQIENHRCFGKKNSSSCGKTNAHREFYGRTFRSTRHPFGEYRYCGRFGSRLGQSRSSG